MSEYREVSTRFDINIITDIDISGCYAESQRVQVMPIGRPIVGGLRLDTVSENNYPTMQEFLKSCKVNVKALCNTKFANYEEYRANWHLWGELEYGCFNFFIEVPQLSEQCDLLPSWIHPGKKIDHKMLCKLLADAIKGDEKAIDKIKQGQTKKLLNQIEISPINFDCLEWLFFTATPKLRKEILEKAKVIAFVIYPKSNRIVSDKEDSRERFKDCYEQLLAIRANWKPRNSINLNFGDNFILYGEEYRDCHYWFGETIGDLILDIIIGKRKVAQWIKKKSPLDLLYKLFNNTHYGVSISPLFAISNICVGNNITAKCRVLAWCMEKALLGYPTITDGCFFLMNEVLRIKNREIASNCINMDSPNSPLSHENYSTQALPYEFTFEDRNFTYTAKTSEYWMKSKRIYAFCELIQINKTTGVKMRMQCLQPLDRIIKWENGKAVKLKITDVLAQQAKLHIQSCFPLISVVWMDAKSIEVKEIEPEYKKLSSSERTANMVEIINKNRHGLADFEIKDYYHQAVIHGMANYLLINEIAVIKGKGVTKDENEKLLGQFIKDNRALIGWRDTIVKESDCEWCVDIRDNRVLAFRGYEANKAHVAIIECDNQLVKSERYVYDPENPENSINPAKDFMLALAKDANRVPRQFTAIKTRSISIGDYANNPKKFDDWGFKAGDQMKVCLLFTEFSLSQFTFKNKEQYFTWVDDITKSKNKYGQSLEAWFINTDGTLRFQDLCYWCADAIERGVKSPIKELMSYGKRSKPKVGSPSINLSEDNRYHPEWFVYQKVKHCLNTGDLVQNEIEVETDGNINEIEVEV